MVKIALVSLNARYSHSNLAIKYLKEAVSDLIEVDLYDFSINDNLEKILRILIKEGYTHIGFSFYIWNINENLDLIKAIKEVDGKIRIIAGGPEVSFDGEKFMKENEEISYLIIGEGEDKFKLLLSSILEGNDPEFSSILYRKKSEVYGDTVFSVVDNFENIPIIYEDDRYIEDNKYVYYEASRGCPFNCAFCLSSTTKGVRYRKLETVFDELKIFLDKKVQLVKFIDRSFNYNPYQKDIIKFLIDNDNKITTFHMELHPSLIDEEFIEILKLGRRDLFQFEVGLQTTNIKTAKEIKRVGKYHEIKSICKELIQSGSHIHIDLIAGLPYEDYDSFAKSFDDLFDIGPDKIQLGFLKLLKGSALRIHSEKYGYKFFSKAPYEVISNNWLSYNDIMRLKAIEDIVEKYYNERFFEKTLSYLIDNYYKSAWSFFEEMADYWEREEYLYSNISKIDLYNIMNRFLDEKYPMDKYLKELLIYDYYKSGNNRSNKFELLDYHRKINKNYLQDLLKVNEKTIENRTGLDVKNILKYSVIENFRVNPIAITNPIKNIEKDEYYYIFIKNKDRTEIKSIYLKPKGIKNA